MSNHNNKRTFGLAQLLNALFGQKRADALILMLRLYGKLAQTHALYISGWCFERYRAE